MSNDQNPIKLLVSGVNQPSAEVIEIINQLEQAVAEVTNPQEMENTNTNG